MNLGYAYSDNWKNGMLFDVGLLASIAIMISDEDDTSYDCEFMGYCGDDDNAADIASLAYIGISIFKLIDVYNRAEAYNDNLYNRVFGGSRPYFSIEYSIENKSPLLTMSIPLNYK